MPRPVRRHAAAALAALATAVIATSSMLPPLAKADDKAGRFTMAPVEGGIMRLDTMTGAVSTCTRSAAEWACKSAADDMKTLNDEIARLVEENRQLKRQLETATAAPAVPGGGPHTGPSLQLPSEADVDKAFDQLERLMKKFQGRLKGMPGIGPERTPL